MLDVWLGLMGQTPLPPGPLLLPVLSGSMRPVISLGSRILIEPCAGTDCRVGDVSVYLDGDRLVAHRILWFLGSRSKGWVFQKGDANHYGHWIRAVNIKGVVREVFPAEDVASAFPGKDPFSIVAARTSRRDYLRNLLLAGPRQFRDLITGHQSDEGKDE